MAVTKRLIAIVCTELDSEALMQEAAKMLLTIMSGVVPIYVMTGPQKDLETAAYNGFVFTGNTHELVPQLMVTDLKVVDTMGLGTRVLYLDPTLGIERNAHVVVNSMFNNFQE